MQTRIYQRKCDNGSENLKGYQKIIKTTRDAYSGLDQSIYSMSQKTNPARETVPLKGQ
jgi:hypothetical protein